MSYDTVHFNIASQSSESESNHRFPLEAKFSQGNYRKVRQTHCNWPVVKNTCQTVGEVQTLRANMSPHDLQLCELQS